MSAIQPDPERHLGPRRLSLRHSKQLTALRRQRFESHDSETEQQKMEVLRQGGRQIELRGQGACSPDAGAERAKTNHHSEHPEAQLVVGRQRHDRRGGKQRKLSRTN